MLVTLATQPNEKRCHRMKETHIIPIHGCCPMTGNPMEGSTIEIEYQAHDLLLEVASLRAYVDSYVGGRGDVRSMEGMCQQIAQDAANALRCPAWVKTDLIITPNQRMILECSALPK